MLQFFENGLKNRLKFTKVTMLLGGTGVKIHDLNCWPCTCFTEDRPFTKDDFLKESSEFFVFGSITENAYGFILANRGDIANVFLRDNLDEFQPEKHLKSREYLPLNLYDEIASIPYIGKQEKFGLLFNEKRIPVGVIMDIQNIYKLHYTMRMGIYHRDLNIDFYKRIIDNIEEEIFVTDEYGFIQFLNPYAEKVCGVTLSGVIGWHVDELEERGIISSSITKEVFRLNKTCNRMMELHTGETVMATGIPLYGENGSLCNVLATSKNIAELRNVLTHLQDLTSELEEKEIKIEALHHKIIDRENYVMASPEMQQVLRNVMKVAPTDATVLIEGESGTGKEVISDLIYKFSNRTDKPFIKINCAMIPEHLLESEFFGYEAGAFTGANRQGKKGKIEMANGGTLFLDELGEMPLTLQAKILEVLQDREFVRVGGVERIPVDVRFIAATNRDLWSMVNEGTFRKDLYYRLNVIKIFLYPLRRRTDDIIPLCNVFLKKFNVRFGENKVFAPSVLHFFTQQDWPGNVRELMHLIERIVITCDNDVISVADVKRVLNGEMSDLDENPMKSQEIEISSLKKAKQELELTMVKKAYDAFHSSYKVAEMLGISQAAVMKILKRNGYHLKNGNVEKIEQ